MSLELVFATVVITAVLIAARLIVVEQRLRGLVMLNAKVDALLGHSGISLNPRDNLPAELRAALLDAISRGRKLEAVKRYREESNTGLQEAKEFIEMLSKHDRGRV